MDGWEWSGAAGGGVGMRGMGERTEDNWLSSVCQTRRHMNPRLY